MPDRRAVGATARAVPWARRPLSGEQRRPMVQGLRIATHALRPDRLCALIDGDKSLYRDYLWPLERLAVARFIDGQRALAEGLVLDDLLDLLGEARPDLAGVISENGGRPWLLRQGRGLRAVGGGA